MATPTYTALQTITLGSSASSVTFASIPATYRDLVLVIRARGTITSYVSAQMRFNGDSSSAYSSVAMYGTGSGQSSYAETIAQINMEQIARSNDTSGVFTPIVAQIMDYSDTSKHKTVLTRNSSMGNSQVVAGIASRWANTSAITSIYLFPYSGNFEAGSTFSLYGIKA